jgi:predicted transcriptional regulator
MSVPCEVAVKCVLPVARAMIAKELVTKYKLKQTEAAQLLKVSQPAISHYGRKTRGKAINLKRDKDVGELVQNIAKSLAEGKPSRRDLIPKYCEICKTIRAKGLLCKLHKTFDQTIDIEACTLCLPNKVVSCI